MVCRHSARDGQVRLWWQETPVDVFLKATPLHEPAASRAHREVLGRTRMPFLSCLDTAIFKAFFNRTKDWSDLEEMAKADRLEVHAVGKTLVEALAETDERMRTLDRLARTGRALQA